MCKLTASESNVDWKKAVLEVCEENYTVFHYAASCFFAIFPLTRSCLCTLLRSSQVWAFHLLPFCVRGELLVPFFHWCTLPVWTRAAHCRYICTTVGEWIRNHTDLRSEAFHCSVFRSVFVLRFMYWSSPVNLWILSYLHWHGFLPPVQMCTHPCSYPLLCNEKSRYFRLVQACVYIRCFTVLL